MIDFYPIFDSNIMKTKGFKYVPFEDGDDSHKKNDNTDDNDDYNSDDNLFDSKKGNNRRAKNNSKTKNAKAIKIVNTFSQQILLFNY